jgi:hypothetical protein
MEGRAASSEQGLEEDAVGPNRSRARRCLVLDLWLIRLDVLLRQRRQCRVHAVPGQIRAMIMLPFG